MSFFVNAHVSAMDPVDYTFENGVKADVDHLRGTVKPLEAGKIKVTVSLKKHPEIKAIIMLLIMFQPSAHYIVKLIETMLQQMGQMLRLIGG